MRINWKYVKKQFHVLRELWKWFFMPLIILALFIWFILMIQLGASLR